MIEIKNKEECCGCFGCYNICPNQCIEMKIDNEGFKYPDINKNNCINCGLCEKVCPVIQKNNEKKNVEVYACKNKNLKTRVTSSSGGVFFNLVEYVIKNSGVVFGAKFNSKFEVIHGYGETLKECEEFKGSKYVQSSIKDNYKLAKKFLDQGRTVLFSGTQCQIKGLNFFLRKKYNNLITVDIICHGVPSPLVFKKYIELKKITYNSDIKEIKFRDKEYGWKKFSYSMKFNNGKIYKKDLSEDLFMKGFLRDLYLRPSCYKCSAKKFQSNSDISLADYWGIENIHPEIDDDKGTSLILVNTDKGKEIFSKISKELDVIESDFEFAVNNNPCIIRPVNYNKDRDKFFQEFTEDNLEKVIDKYTRVSIVKKIKIKTYSVIKKLIK